MALLSAGSGAVRDLDIEAIELRLEAGAAPVVAAHLAAGSEATAPAWLAVEGSQGAGVAGSDVTLDIDGIKVGGLFLGFKMVPTLRHEGEKLVPAAIVVAADATLRSWFDQTTDADGHAWLVHQRSRTATAWEFMTGLTDGLLHPLAGVDLDTLFDPEMCILRPAGWRNGKFLDHLVALLAERSASVWGWTAVNDMDKAPPLRLIHDGKPGRLAGWTAVAGAFDRDGALFPSSLSGRGATATPMRLGRQFSCSNPGRFFEGAARLGSNGKAGELREYVEGTQSLVLAPGPVDLPTTRDEPLRLFARAVTYAWQTGRSVVSGSVELAPPPTPTPRPAGPVVFDAAFQAWVTTAKGEGSLAFAPAGPRDPQAGPDAAPLGARWVIAGDTLTIAARALTPFAGHEAGTTTGLYPRRQQGDRFTLLIASGQAPVAIGQSQRHHATAEAVDFLLNVESFTVSVTEIDAGLADAETIGIEPGRVRLTPAETVEVMQQLTVTTDVVTVKPLLATEADFETGGKAVVKGDVNVDGKLFVG